MSFAPGSFAPGEHAAPTLGPHVDQPHNGAVVIDRETLLHRMYSRQGADLVIVAAEGGRHVIKNFFIGDTPSGPPFGIDRGELDALLAPHFDLLDDLAVDGSLPVFQGRERWMTWRRRALVPHGA